MIVGELKPLAAIADSLRDAENVYIIGCGGCVTVCQSGGEKAARELALLLQQHRNQINYQSGVIPRQCETEFLGLLAADWQNIDTVVSLGCGVGVQALAHHYPKLRVVPGLNTMFMGMPLVPGQFAERCLGCGNCILDKTAGICPITRCAKSLLNGPCGGSQDGKCEIGGGRECAWQLIYDRLTERGEAESLNDLWLPRDWRSSHHGGPRQLLREDVMLSADE
ncbi:MAG: methylenetetrahydrofolate reductase C-terminal domain-containing protein [Methylocystaceae bacterium]